MSRFAEIPVMAVGGVTRQGQIREENQDAIEVAAINKDTALMVVCDGVGGHAGGAAASQAASRYLSTYIQSRLFAGARQRFNVLAEAVTELQFAFQAFDQEGFTTAIVALVRGEQLYYATIGDGALLVVFPDQMIQSLLVPHHGFGQPSNMLSAYVGAERFFEPRLGLIHFPKGSMALAMSDGAEECLPAKEVQRQLPAYRDYALKQGAESLCTYFLDAMESARDPETHTLIHSDNLTLSVIVTDLPRRAESGRGSDDA